MTQHLPRIFTTQLFMGAVFLFLLRFLFLLFRNLVLPNSAKTVFLTRSCPLHPTPPPWANTVMFLSVLTAGIPSVSVPLGEMKGKFLSLPISLSYHASGIKVDEVASSTGLGWSLSAGGVITRTIHGLLDEAQNGFISYDYDANNVQQLLDISQNIRDTEADMFYFNVGGFSGKFFLDRVNGVVVPRLVDFQDLKVELVPATNTVPMTFKITAPDGTVYSFATPEYTNAPNPIDGANNQFILSWYLTNITHITGDAINFGYRLGNTADLSYIPGLSEQTGVGPIQGDVAHCQLIYSHIQASASQTIKMLYPDYIESYHNRVEFVYGDRLDFATGALALQQVVFKNKSDYAANTFVKVKTEDLAYDYFQSIGIPALQATEPRHLKRLKLTKVTETGYGLDGTSTALPPYQFTYNEPDFINYRLG